MKNLKGLLLSALIATMVLGNIGLNLDRVQVQRGRSPHNNSISIMHEPNPALR